MTNFERITKNIYELAQMLVQYNDSDGMFYTSDDESFDTSEEALYHEIEWLKKEI